MTSDEGRDRSPLQRMVATTPTELWNDSCAVDELAYAIEHGAVGATTNPTIVDEVLAREAQQWRDRIRQLVDDHPSWCERRLTWRLIEQMAVRGAELLRPVFEREHGRCGRLSIQTDPTLFRDSEAIVAQAVHLDGLAPNIQVKIPATRAGLVAIEEATSRGVNVNATVCFSVAQSLAVAEAVERGLERLQRSGGDPQRMTPVCTIMVGRLDDWLKVVAARDGVAVTPGHIDWAGIACIKRAHAIYRDRGHRTRLLAAAYRHHLHWSELIGGDLVLTMTHAWQRVFNASWIEVRPRFDDPVPAAIVEQLSELLPDFRRAHEPDGLAVADFDSYGATRRTLRSFCHSYAGLLARVREVLLPDPDRELSGAPQVSR